MVYKDAGFPLYCFINLNEKWLKAFHMIHTSVAKCTEIYGAKRQSSVRMYIIPVFCLAGMLIKELQQKQIFLIKKDIIKVESTWVYNYVETADEESRHKFSQKIGCLFMIKLRGALFVTYTIIQRITSSGMCLCI